MRLSKGFTSFVGISLSCLALLISKSFICGDISSAVVGSKENVLFLSTEDTSFLMIEMFLALHKYLSSTLVPRFGAISVKKCVKSVDYLVFVFY